jgi:lipopolysaccharide transport system ATP-binding protein
MSEVAIRVAGLGKQYRLGGPQARYHTLGDQIRKWTSVRTLLRRRTRDEKRPPFWALKGVSFEVRRGEVIGVIGRNGAGKSTLLKVLSRITEPTEGEVDIYGRVGSLLEVGTGFHPELTGRENVYLNGAILGMRRSEIVRKFDEIVSFAEVEKFIDTPVKHYSSGMYMRLAFAVAAHLEPEILIVDEVLAVGDAEFQKKCLGKMGDVAKSGRTVLFVSHNMAAVANLCNRGLLLHKGELAADGPTADIVARYNGLLSSSTGGYVDLSEHPSRLPGSVPLVRAVCLRNGRGEATDVFPCGEAVAISIEVVPVEPIAGATCGIGVDDVYGQRIFSVTMPLEGVSIPRLDRPTTVTCRLPAIALAPGAYSLSISVGDHHRPLTDALPNAVSMTVSATDFYTTGRIPSATLGKILVRSDWSWEPGITAPPTSTEQAPSESPASCPAR